MELQSSTRTQEVLINKSNDIKGYRHAIKITRFLLSLLGGWPDPEKNSSMVHFGLVVTTMFCFETASQTVKMANNMNNLDFLVLIIVDCNVPATISIMKLSNVWYHRNILKNLLRQMIEDWKTPRNKNELDTMWKYAWLTRYYCIGFVIINKSALYAQTISNFWEPIKFLISGNDTSQDWPLYFSGSLPYDYKSHPNYELTLLGQYFSITCASLSYDSTDGFYCVLMFHLIAQLCIMKKRILELTENQLEDINNENNTFLNKFRQLHKMHDHLWRFSLAINKSFSTMFLMQMIPSMLVLCTQGYLLLLITGGDKIFWAELIYLMYFLLLFLMTLFAYCYIAEILRQKSMEISYAVYSCDWTTLPPKDVKLLLLMIERAQNPFEITVGKFAPFSLNLYCSILKTSAGYLSVLLAVKDRTDQ